MIRRWTQNRMPNRADHSVARSALWTVALLLVALNGTPQTFAEPFDDRHVSRFELDGDELVLDSEVVLLEIPTQRRACCHSGGALAFGPDSSLYIGVGDNTNSFDCGAPRNLRLTSKSRSAIQVTLDNKMFLRNMTIVITVVIVHKGGRMPSISKSKLKANMLRIFREIEETGEEWVVTDHNRPVLRIQPIAQKKTVEEVFGAIQGKVVYREDINTPTTDEWGALA